MKYKTRFFSFFAAMVLFSLATSFAHPVTPTVIQELRLHDYMFGLALALMMSANFLMSPFWGKINGYISSRLTLLISCCGYGVAQLFFAYSTTEFQIGCARLLAGVFVGGIFVSFLTYIVNMAEPVDQPRFLTYSATIQSVCGTFGYFIGGMVGEYSVKAAFILQAAVLIVSGILFFIICLPDKTHTDKLTLSVLAKDANPLKAFLDCREFMTGAVLTLFAVGVLMNFGNTGFDQAFNYFLKDQLGFTSSYNGIIKAAVGLVSFAANMTLCIWIIKKTDTGKSLAVICGISIGAALCTVFFSETLPFIAFGILLYTAFSVSLPVHQNMVATLADAKQKGLVMGAYNASKSLGSIAGSLIAGFIYSAGAKLPFIFTAIVYVAAFVAILVYIRMSRKQA